MFSSGMLWATGDLVSQRIESRHWNKRRTARHAAFGLFIEPIGSRWYPWIDRVVSRAFVKKSLPFVGAKVALDTLLWGPFVTGSYLCVTQNQWNFQEFRKLLLFESAYWPVLDMVNFRYVPVQRQMSFMNVASIGDTVYLSHHSNRLGQNPSNEPTHRSSRANHRGS